MIGVYLTLKEVNELVISMPIYGVEIALCVICYIDARRDNLELI